MNCWTLVIGTGTGNFPVMDAVKHEAKRRGIKLLILPIAEAIAAFEGAPGSGETDPAYHLLGATMSIRPRNPPLIGRQSSCVRSAHTHNRRRLQFAVAVRSFYDASKANELAWPFAE